MKKIIGGKTSRDYYDMGFIMAVRRFNRGTDRRRFLMFKTEAGDITVTFLQLCRLHTDIFSTVILATTRKLKEKISILATKMKYPR